MRLLLLEDEPGIAKHVRRSLEAHGYAVTTTETLAQARAALLEAEYDLLILDVRVPDHANGGFVVASEARLAGYRGKILFMTARDALDDRVNGLDIGGDDYVTKPFELPELLARVRALLRRDSEATSSEFTRGRLSFYFQHREARWDGVPVSLTARELSVLERLIFTSDRVISGDELMDTIWGEEAVSGVVKVVVHHLRQKLAADVVVTDHGRGYRLGPCRGES